MRVVPIRLASRHEYPHDPWKGARTLHTQHNIRTPFVARVVIKLVLCAEILNTVAERKLIPTRIHVHLEQLLARLPGSELEKTVCELNNTKAKMNDLIVGLDLVFGSLSLSLSPFVFD